MSLICTHIETHTHPYTGEVLESPITIYTFNKGEVDVIVFQQNNLVFDVHIQPAQIRYTEERGSEML